MVPEAGVEPAQSQGPGDFESPAYTSFTTPAQGSSFCLSIVSIDRKVKQWLNTPYTLNFLFLEISIEIEEFSR